MRLASDTVESNLWLPSTFFALNYTFGGGIPFGKVLEVAGEESSGNPLLHIILHIPVNNLVVM